MSFSNVEDPEPFIVDYGRVYAVCLEQQCAVVVGAALTDTLRQSIQYASYGNNLQHLRAFGQSLYMGR